MAGDTIARSTLALATSIANAHVSSRAHTVNLEIYLGVVCSLSMTGALSCDTGPACKLSADPAIIAKQALQRSAGLAGLGHLSGDDIADSDKFLKKVFMRQLDRAKAGKRKLTVAGQQLASGALCGAATVHFLPSDSKEWLAFLAVNYYWRHRCPWEHVKFQSLQGHH